MTQAASLPCVGLWVTDDGHIRHELLASGLEASGTRERRSRSMWVMNRGPLTEKTKSSGVEADHSW